MGIARIGKVIPIWSVSSNFLEHISLCIFGICNRNCNFFVAIDRNLIKCQDWPSPSTEHIHSRTYTENQYIYVHIRIDWLNRSRIGVAAFAFSAARRKLLNFHECTDLIYVTVE